MKIHEPLSTNPRGKTVKYLVEIKLKITNVVCREHKKQIQKENTNNINCLEEI